MPTRTVGGDADALLLFADVVDSSKYSSVLGFGEYAKRLLHFQATFKDLGERYFPKVEDEALAYTYVDARGDEGIVFILDPQCRWPELAFRAIEFLYHLKGVLRFGADEEREQHQAPSRLRIGAGIHLGRVAYTVTLRESRSVIVGLEGFAINYAKRVESCSREGRYSQIMLSSEAAKCLELEPVLFRSMRSGIKGIADNVELFEVQSGLFDDFQLCLDRPADERMIQAVCDLVERPEAIDESWIKGFAVSLLECLCGMTPVQLEKTEYRKRQLGLAWHRTNEDDPILLFLRSREHREARQYTQEIRYLRRIMDEHPELVHARLFMIKACWALVKSKAERAEKVYARDMAQEFLDHFPRFLNDEEKEEFRRLIEASSKSRSRPTKRKRHRSKPQK